MPRYIILPNTTDKTDGENISTYIFQLSRPQTPGTTKRHCGVIQHPTDWRVALVWPDSDDTTVALIQSTEKKNNVKVIYLDRMRLRCIRM